MLVLAVRVIGCVGNSADYASNIKLKKLVASARVIGCVGNSADYASNIKLKKLVALVKSQFVATRNWCRYRIA